MMYDEHEIEENSGVIVPEREAGQYYRVAGFWIRALAFVIDLVIIACVNGVIFHWLLPGQNGDTVIHKIIGINQLFLGITGAAYFIVMTRYYQQTLGKMITGIKVIQAGGRPLDWNTAVLRELVSRSLSQMLGLYLGYVFCWFNRDKQCLHDMLTDTWVVHVKPQKDQLNESLRYAGQSM